MQKWLQFDENLAKFERVVTVGPEDHLRSGSCSDHMQIPVYPPNFFQQ
jgi:hypothetical protein